VKHLPKVFAVDHDSAVLDAIATFLTGYGYDVRCYSSAKEFLAQHHPTEVGCVLVDLSMRDMGGSEMLRHLQDTGSLLSVIITTGLFQSTKSSSPDDIGLLRQETPYKLATLLRMVEDGVAGSIRRRAERKRGKGSNRQ
jgi:FixJ family two-component response regulator